MVGLIIGAIGAVASAIASALSTSSTLLLTVANAFMAFAKALDLTETEEPEVLGDKIIQAEEEGISPEKYETYREYMQAVDDFEIDKEKSQGIPTEEKVIRAIDATAKVLEEKYPDSDMEGLLTAASSPENQEYFTSERFGLIAKEIENDPELVDSLSKLLNGKEIGEKEYYNLLDTLTSIEHKLYPEKTETEIGEYLRSLG